MCSTKNGANPHRPTELRQKPATTVWTTNYPTLSTWSWRWGACPTNPEPKPPRLFRRSAVHGSGAVSTLSPIGREAMSRRQVRPTRAVPTPRTGSILPAGAGAGFPLMPPDPQTVGLYVAALASGADTGTPTGKKKCRSTIERRLSSLTWNYAQRGLSLDRKDRHIATVMAGIRNGPRAPPRLARRKQYCPRI